MVLNFFQEVEEAARKAGLEFLVIGGFAVIKHGYERFTKDCDLLVPNETKADWHAIMLEMGYVLISDQDAFRQYAWSKGVAWPVDLMFVHTETFKQLVSAARPAVIHDARVRLVSLEHLLALKLHVLKQRRMHRFLKDFEDVVKLVHFNKVDLSSPEMRGLFLKYGTAELYEKIRGACANQ